MYFADSLQVLEIGNKLTADIEWRGLENHLATHMIEFRYGDRRNGLSFILFSQSCFVINVGQKRRKERKKHLFPQQESPFTLKNRTIQTTLVLYPVLRDSGFYSGGFRKVLAQKKVCVCVLNKYALCFYMILFKGLG